MSDLFDMYPSTPVGGDCTCGYSVRLNRRCTVKEFVEAVLAKTSEWGGIDIYDKYKNKLGCITYRYGDITHDYFATHDDLGTKVDKEEVLGKDVVSVSAGGCYTNMGYNINI